MGTEPPCSPGGIFDVIGSVVPSVEEDPARTNPRARYRTHNSSHVHCDAQLEHAPAAPRDPEKHGAEKKQNENQPTVQSINKNQY